MRERELSTFCIVPQAPRRLADRLRQLSGDSADLKRSDFPGRCIRGESRVLAPAACAAVS
jgi:hypothetical protein